MSWVQRDPDTIPLSPTTTTGSMPQSPSDLATLTVARLKLLCKDARLTGYSKLGKAALIEKLTGHFPERGWGPTNANHGPCEMGKSNRKSDSGPISEEEPEAKLANNIRPCIVVGVGLQGLGSIDNPDSGNTEIRSSVLTGPSTLSHQSKKRKDIPRGDGSTFLEHLRKKKKARVQTPTVARSRDREDPVPVIPTQAPCPTQGIENTHEEQSPTVHVKTWVPRNETSCGPDLLHIEERPEILSSSPGSSLGSVKVIAQWKAPKKRFRKLIPSIGKQKLNSVQDLTGIQDKNSVDVYHLRYLDFVVMNDVDLKRITIPITLAHRKCVISWAVILSGLSNAERRLCAKVSKLIRYAGNYMRTGTCTLLTVS